MNIHEQLTQPYILSPIDGNTYCRSNGQFLRHLKINEYEGYQHFFESMYPNLIQYCEHCNVKCSFNITTMSYKQTCGSRACCGRVTSDIRSKRTQEDWDNWKKKYKSALAKKTDDENKADIEKRRQTALMNDSYMKSVNKREQTCLERHGDKKYNNPDAISQKKQQWPVERKQLFLDRLKISLGGKWLNDFTTEQTWINRTEKLAAQGRIPHPTSRPLRVQYYKKVQRLTEKNYRNNKHIINPNNHSRTCTKIVDGYQLDHIMPIHYGFLNNIPVHVVADISNLQMLPWRDNLSKGCKYEPQS